MREMKKHIEKKMIDGKEGEFFMDADVEFDTAKKALILKCLDRSWDIDTLEYVVSLRAKLA